MRSVEALARAEGVSVEEFVDRICDCGDEITFDPDPDFEVDGPSDSDSDSDGEPEAVDTDEENRYRRRV